MADVFNLQASIGLDISEFEQQLAKAMQGAEQLASAFHTASTGVDTMQQSVSRIAGAFGMSNAAVTKGTEYYEALQAQLKELEGASERASNKVEAISYALNKSAEATGIDSAETRKLAADLAEAEAESARLQAQTATLRNRLESAADAASDEAQQTESVSGAFSKLKENVSMILHPFRTLNERMQESSDEAKLNQSRMQSLRGDYDAAKKKVEQLTEKYRESVKATGATSEESRRLAKELSGAESEMKNAESALGKYNDEVEDTKGQSDKASESTGRFGSALGSIAEKAASAAIGIAKVSAAAISIGAAAVSKLAKDSLASYGQYEQLVGGVETLFGAQGMSVEEYAASVGKTVKAVQKEYDSLLLAQETVLANADKAYQTAGLSANEYMETVTSFSASLVQSLDGNKVKAAEVADRAVRDMADNANKMGTAIGSIQNAYQGFAKQNYTMLDNLKLGYGGTKEEMERLIKDAAAMTDVQQRLNIQVKDGDMSFANIANAISVVQSKLGIAGTTAKEAAGTITGSVASMSAAWRNLLTEFAKGDIAPNVRSITSVIENSGVAWEKYNNAAFAASGGVKNLSQIVFQALDEQKMSVDETAAHISKTYGISMADATKAVEAAQESISNFKPESQGNLDKYIDFFVKSVETAAGNIIPRLQVIVDGIGKMIDKLAPMLTERIPELVSSILPPLISAASGMITTIAKNLPALIKAVIPPILSGVREVIKALKSVLPDIIKAVREIMPELISAVTEALPLVIEAGGEILLAMIDGILENMPKIIEAAVVMIKTLSQGLVDNLPTIIQAGIDILLTLTNAIIENIDTILAAVVMVIDTLVTALLTGENLKKLLDAGLNLLMSIADAIVKNLPMLIDTAVKIITFITTELFKGDNLNKLLHAGIEILAKLIDAIVDNIDDIFIALEELVFAIVDYFSDPENVKDIIATGVKILGKLIEGLCKVGGKLLGFAWDLITELGTSLFQMDWVGLGRQLLEGLLSGLTGVDFNFSEFFGNFKENFVSGLKDIFNIHSPSKVMRDEIGKFLALGIGEGFEDEADAVRRNIIHTVSGLTDDMQTALDSNPIGVSMSASTATTGGSMGASQNISFAGAEIRIVIDGAGRNGADIADEIAERLAYMSNLENLKAGVVAL